MIKFIIGLIIGVYIGVGTMCLIAMRRSDEDGE